jgi:hypothetical protein
MRCVALVKTDVSEERIASIIGVQRIREPLCLEHGVFFFLERGKI